MKAWLVVQGGSEQGPVYALDPFEKPIFTIGRSSGCDIVMQDQRTSRHHCDIRWNGRQWEVVDRGSTNGTFVNGSQVYRPWELRTGDRISLGETTMILRDSGPQPAGLARAEVGSRQASWQPPAEPARHQAGRPEPEQVMEQRLASALATVTFWLVQVIVAVAIVCLAAGAFLPWIRVTGSLSQDLAPLLQGLANIVSILSGPNSMLNMTQEIGGLEGYGKLTLAIAVISLVAFVVDVFFHRRSAVPGIVYLVLGLTGTGAIAFDLINYYRLYDQMKDLSLLFGVRLEQVVQVFDQFLDVQVTPMVGLVLTAAGLVLLLAGGIGRLGALLLDPDR